MSEDVLCSEVDQVVEKVRRTYQWMTEADVSDIRRNAREGVLCWFRRQNPPPPARAVRRVIWMRVKGAFHNHHHRVLNPHGEVSLDALCSQSEERGKALVDTLASDSPDPAEVVIRAEIVQRVRDALRQINQNFAEAIRLVYLEGLSAAEAARWIGCEVATVKTRLHRGRIALGRELAPYFGA